jgi:hypothetical protein
LSREWIGKVLNKQLPTGIVLTVGNLSFNEIDYDNEWSTTTNEKNIMYKVYICGKIVTINERAIGSKIQ